MIRNPRLMSPLARRAYIPALWGLQVTSFKNPYPSFFEMARHSLYTPGMMKMGPPPPPSHFLNPSIMTISQRSKGVVRVVDTRTRFNWKKPSKVVMKRSQESTPSIPGFKWSTTTFSLWNSTGKSLHKYHSNRHPHPDGRGVQYHYELHATLHNVTKAQRPTDDPGLRHMKVKTRKSYWHLWVNGFHVSVYEEGALAWARFLWKYQARTNTFVQDGTTWRRDGPLGHANDETSILNKVNQIAAATVNQIGSAGAANAAW